MTSTYEISFKVSADFIDLGALGLFPVVGYTLHWSYLNTTEIYMSSLN